ncbi:hypothetical protein RA086_05445 [Lactiplantibacillus sp. WILCCON 0030]|uniref:Prophage protein n=1 Tax=Lactiplantibacillus brownii TaxID=3069269 RepID=A0ABU1A800_9LACO|nr:hypothetical protein [Lactiplantibacillus brownii]MDQ7937071.1 hypothetical protein [Lactiplantibacillus brownii]
MEIDELVTRVKAIKILIAFQDVPYKDLSDTDPLLHKYLNQNLIDSYVFLDKAEVQLNKLRGFE